ncbi:MAG: tRNA-binding protein [Thaumarchaeota archaeon]|nr:tRNA-binding protein [Nitrososphaerota archaeon]
MVSQISYEDFARVEIRVGKILEVLDFPEARKPAYRLKLDFGNEVGLKWSSAQLTKRYSKEDLVGRRIVAVVNFPPKKVASFTSEVLVLGVDDGNCGVMLLSPESEDAPLGMRVY